MTDSPLVPASLLYLATHDAFRAAMLYDHALDPDEKQAHLERWKQAVRDMTQITTSSE